MHSTQKQKMHYDIAALSIPGSGTGIYLAYPTSPVLKFTHPGHKTLVNDQHTKIGIARNSFVARENEYMWTFQREVAFVPLLELQADVSLVFEARVLALLLARFPLSGSAREWFRTTERQAIAEIVWRLHAQADA